jgi:hypothetical protein
MLFNTFGVDLCRADDSDGIRTGSENLLAGLPQESLEN